MKANHLKNFKSLQPSGFLGLRIETVIHIINILKSKNMKSSKKQLGEQTHRQNQFSQNPVKIGDIMEGMQKISEHPSRVQILQFLYRDFKNPKYVSH